MLFHYIYLQMAPQANVLFQKKSDLDFLLISLVIILDWNQFLLQYRVAHQGTTAAQITASE